MIHFFPLFSDAADTEFGHALRRIGVEHKIFSNPVAFNYRSRLKLLLVCIPRLVFASAKVALASLVFSRPQPDVVVLGSDIEVLIFALVRALGRRRRVRIAFGCFIFTSRKSEWQNSLRKLYFRFVLSHVDVVAVHSRLEVERYSELFAGLSTKFCFVPWGTNIDSRSSLLGEAKFAPGRDGLIVTAGRSGRDYGTLFRAMNTLDAELHIICDYLTEKPEEISSARVTLLTDCYGDAYLRELIDAALVVVPLLADDISAGQMVLVQSMGLGKAIVITDTPTVRDYVTDRQDAWLVPRGDATAMHEAILHLLNDAKERERLARNARDTFDRKLSAEGYLRSLIAAITECDRTVPVSAVVARG